MSASDFSLLTRIQKGWLFHFGAVLQEFLSQLVILVVDCLIKLVLCFGFNDLLLDIPQLLLGQDTGVEGISQIKLLHKSMEIVDQRIQIELFLAFLPFSADRVPYLALAQCSENQSLLNVDVAEPDLTRSVVGVKRQHVYPVLFDELVDDVYIGE